MNFLANLILPLVTQMVKNLPEMWDAQVQSLGQVDSLENSHGAWRITFHGSKDSDRHFLRLASRKKSFFFFHLKDYTVNHTHGSQRMVEEFKRPQNLFS